MSWSALRPTVTINLAKTLRASLAAVMCTLAAVPGQAFAANDPSVAPTQSAADRVLPGHVLPELASAQPLRPLDSNRTLTLSISLQPRDVGGLKSLAHEQADPQSPRFHRFITADEFGARFAPEQAGVDAVTAYLLAQGFHDVVVEPNRLIIHASAPVDMVTRALHVQLAEYEVHGRIVHSPLNEPSLPGALGGLVHAIYGLDNVPRFHPQLTRAEAAPRYGGGPAGGFTPSELRTAYDATPLIDVANGSGQNIALVEFDSYQASDVSNYIAQYGPSTLDVHNVPIDGGPPGVGNGALEVALDMQVLAALAPGASQWVYMAPNMLQGEIDMYNRIVTDNIAKVVSVSWGECEALVGSLERQDMDVILNQAAAQGQAIFAAAGDAGAYDCGGYLPPGTLAVDFPASNPVVVSVGGTTLRTGVNGVYVSESVWGCSTCGTGGGGGLSTLYAMPGYQYGPGVLNAWSNGNRELPDVSAAADPATGYAVYCTVAAAGCNPSSGWMVVGGTSAAAPLWAAVTTDINQYLLLEGRATMGSASAILYKLFRTSQQLAPYHDVTAGTNLYYAATAAFDLASGIGSPDAWNIARDIAGTLPRVPIVSTTTVTCTPVTVNVGTATSCTATVADAGALPATPGGTVAWLSDGSGTFGAPSCTLSIVSATTAACTTSYQAVALGSGIHTLTATYGGDTSHASSAGSLQLTVQNAVSCSPRPAVSVSAVAGSAGQLIVTIAANGAGNAIRSIQFGSGSNVLLDAGSVAGSSGNFTWSLPPATRQRTFVVRRAAPGPSTVPLTVTDACGSWQTLVGGGASAF